LPATLAVLACLALAVSAPAAWSATSFHPRIGGAMGLVPPFGSHDVATGALTPVVYHAGPVMSGGVTVHTIFWTPPGFQFDGSPAPGVPGYEALIKQYLTDIAHDSGSSGNVFSVLPQFAQGTHPGGVTPGAYSIGYDPSGGAIDDTAPYPAAGDQCASPNNVSTCITDAQVQAEVDRVVQSTPGTPRGLHNLWFVLLPPNVDECITAGACGTNAFGGYHSLSNLGGHGVTIYAVAIDPLIEMAVPPGSDPQGNPDAEAAADVAGHETEEAMSDPTGVGWLDPNGFESADKCEFGPQHGTPLGFAGIDHAPYNQVINGNRYFTQEMWSNDDNGCVQRTTLSSNPLPLPQVNLSQFGSTVTGNVGANRPGVGVRVTLQRATADGSPVSLASPTTTTGDDGSWSVSIAPHAVGDDRDQITVDYAGAGAPAPGHQTILTGNGGNPFTESGWTGWFDLDNGSFVTSQPSLGGPSVTVGPCFQTGVLGLSAGVNALSSPTDFCNTQTDTATVGTAVGRSVVLSASSNDNRAFSPPADGSSSSGAASSGAANGPASSAPTPNLGGGLVSLSVPVGEADAVSLYSSPLATFTPSGFPSCAADLEAQTVTCAGLVTGDAYTLTDGRTRAHLAQGADRSGTITGQFVIGTLQRGDAISLSNGSRTLTTLHVAHLEVAIAAEQAALSGGTCEPGDYYGPSLTDVPTNPSAGGPGVALTGEICPVSGHAAGLPSSSISQTDERSGGQTQTEVPDIADTSPLQGETVYGPFTALAQAAFADPGNSILPADKTSTIALRIARAAGGAAVFHAGNVDTVDGVPVKGLRPGTYNATWTLKDANGDTRTLSTRFIEQPGAGGPARRRVSRGPRPRVRCTVRRHRTIRCTVSYPRARHAHGMVRMTIAGGGALEALGHAAVRHGQATVTLHERRRLAPGAWTVTLVLIQPHKAPMTSRIVLPRGVGR